MECKYTVVERECETNGRELRKVGVGAGAGETKNKMIISGVLDVQTDFLNARVLPKFDGESKFSRVYLGKTSCS